MFDSLSATPLRYWNPRGRSTSFFELGFWDNIPLRAFFAATRRALVRGGRLAFIVHKENSPREPLEIFAELVAQDPSILTKRVAFDFPRDSSHVQNEITAVGLTVEGVMGGERQCSVTTAPRASWSIF